MASSGAKRQSEMAAVVSTLPSEEELEAKCIELGLVMRRPPKFDITHPAVTLFPSVMEAHVLRELYAKQVLWNEAIDRTARQFAFLRDSLRETAASDVSFTGKLVEILERVYLRPPVLPETAKVKIDHPVFQPLMLGIFRSDYMRAMDGVPAQEPGKPRPKETAEQWKNVEINTISCSFAALSTLVGQFHNYLDKYRRVLLAGKTDADTAKAATEVAAAAAHKSKKEHAHQDTSGNTASGEVEASISLNAIPEALAGAVEAWKASLPFHAFVEHYRDVRHKTEAGQDPAVAEAIAQLAEGGDASEIPVQPVVLVVIQEDERNTGDQYKLLFNLLEQHGVISIRRTLTQLHDSMELVHFNGSHKKKGSPTITPETSKYATAPFAVVEKKYVASVVYFRSTYVPNDFLTAACWESREWLERSNAVKCPSIPYHLMTFKKMQQLLSLVPTVLVPVAFSGNVKKATDLAVHFMPQYSLNKQDYAAKGKGKESGEGGAVENDPEVYIRDAIEHPSEYVLKPQLEGGGNLIAGSEMQKLLRNNQQETDPYYAKIRKEYILMKKIHFEKKDGLLFRHGQMFFFEKNACSELGIFGCILSDGTESTYDPSNSNVDETGSIRATAAGTPVTAKVFNRYGGYNMRTKPADVDDGGVMAGVACLDNVRLL